MNAMSEEPDLAVEGNYPNSVEVSPDRMGPGAVGLVQVASWLAPGDSMIVDFDGVGVPVFETDMRTVESRFSGRRTGEGLLPPFKLRFSRSTDGLRSGFELFRVGRTTGEWERIVSCIKAHSDDSYKVSGASNVVIGGEVNPAIQSLLSPFYEGRKQTADTLCGMSPNRLLMRYPTFRTGSRKQHEWVPFAAPSAIEEKEDESSGKLNYRVYINPGVAGATPDEVVKEHYEQVRRVMAVLRRYPGGPLNGKFLYNDEKLEEYLRDPEESKIVLYFTSAQKREAHAFAQWLSQQPEFADPLSEGHVAGPRFLREDRRVLQRTLCGGLIGVGKGTKERRRDIVDRARYIGAPISPHLQHLLEMHSIRAI